MPQHTCDRISRPLRGGLTRRTALRNIGGGLAAALVQSSLPPSAAQAATPDMVYEIEGR